MKKFLLSIFCCLMALVSVQAEDLTATLSFANKAQRTSFSTSKQVWEQNGIKLTNDKGSSSSNVADYANPARFYKSSKITIDAPGNIDKIEFTCNGGSYATALKSSIKNTEATASVNGSVVTAIPVNTGTSFTIASLTGGQVRMNSLKVYYTVAGGDEEDNQTATPVITPNGGEITADTKITISCENEGAQIYYTINGDEPTTSSTSYSGPFTLDAPATVKAIAVADGLEASAVATAEFTFPVVCENIAAFIANADEDNNATISGEVVVVAQRANYLFIEDENGKMIVYGTLGKTYKAGDRLTGIKGKYKNYNGLHEMYPDTESFGEATAGDAIEPVAITLDELATTDLLTYVTVSNVTVPAETNDDDGKSYTITDATGEVTMYNTLSINVPAGVATITGFVGTYKTTRQLMPLVIEITEQAVDVAEPTFTPESGETFDESLEVTIEAEEGLTVYYSTDNKETYTEGKTLNITETTTVYAYAENADGDVSDIVSATYTKNTPVTPPVEGETVEVVDVLNREFTGIKNGETSYSSWNGKKAASAAVYAGNSAGSNDAIQLRSNNSNSGIVTTVSGGKAKRIVVEWNAKTSSGRTLEIYGKNTAYTSPTELYATTGNTGQGKKLGDIVCGTSTELIIETDYEYIGLRSKSGAMYIDEIQIIWAVEAEEPASAYTLSVTAAGWATLYLDFAAAIPAEVEAYTVTEVNNGYVTLTQVEGVLPANTGIIVKADEANYTFAYSTAAATANVEGNLLEGSAAAEEKDFEAYVLGNDGGVGLYKAKMTDGKWLNNANKAYLPASVASGAASYSFRFGEGTTAIENVEVENEVKAIFDLTGRRVEEVTAPGIYIINGKKVLVK